jgi:flagellar biogenesis protein FliO
MFALVLASATLLAASAAPAQATQPAGEIRRSAAASAASNPAGPSATRVAFSLAAVLALIVILFVAGRRFLPRGSFARHGGGGGSVQVLARTAISPKQRIVLLQIGRRILVVADGGASLSTLCEITDADEATSLIGQLQSEKAGGSFTAALNSAMDRFRAAQHEPPVPSAPREPQPSLDAMREEIEGLAKRVRGMAR